MLVGRRNISFNGSAFFSPGDRGCLEQTTSPFIGWGCRQRACATRCISTSHVNRSIYTCSLRVRRPLDTHLVTLLSRSRPLASLEFSFLGLFKFLLGREFILEAANPLRKLIILSIARELLFLVSRSHKRVRKTCIIFQLHPPAEIS